MLPSRIPAVGLLVALVLAWGASPAGASRPQDDKAKEEEAAKLGVEAYIYGYPLVTMEMTRRVMTNVASRKAMRGPMGQFINATRVPDRRRSGTLPLPTPTRSTRSPGSTLAKNLTS